MNESLSGPYEKNGAVELVVYVQPRARKSEVVGSFNGMPRLKIAAPPVDNAANAAVIEFFARLLRIPKSRIHIVSGEKSREKRLRFEGVPVSTVAELVTGLLRT